MLLLVQWVLLSCSDQPAAAAVGTQTERDFWYEHDSFLRTAVINGDSAVIEATLEHTLALSNVMKPFLRNV